MTYQVNQPRYSPRRQRPRYSYTPQPAAISPLPMLNQITTALNTMQQVSALLGNPMVQALMPMLLGGGTLASPPLAAGLDQQNI